MQATKASQAGQRGLNLKYTTRDIVIIAALAAIAGVINTGTAQVWNLANSALGPMGGALLQGAFMWAYVLAVWLVRKPGTALILGIIESCVELLLGNPAGIGTLGWGLSQGLGIEGVMLIAGYSRFGLWAAVAAGAASSQFGTIWSAILYGWDPAAAKDVWLAMPINMISGAIVSGGLGYVLAQAIKRTGLVRSAG